ncbi:MAG: hypothetical protein WC505_05725 [Patescibacteria group bacterium]
MKTKNGFLRNYFPKKVWHQFGAIRNKYIGKRVGKLTIVEVMVTEDYHFVCECACGEMCTKSYGSIIQSTRSSTLSCGCSMYQRQAGADSYLWKGCGEISARAWRGYTTNAKTRNIQVDLSLQEAWDIFVIQNRICPLSGEKLQFSDRTNHGTEITASLDRKNSALGYTKENSWWVHKKVNEMKWDLELDYFLYLCRLVATPLQHSTPNPAIYAHTHHLNFKGYGNIALDFYSQYRRNAAVRDLEFNLTIQEMWDVFVAQHGYCALTGLAIKPKKYGQETTASLDRIDNSKGYALDNVQWVHKDINSRLRRNLSLTTLREWCTKITRYSETKTEQQEQNENPHLHHWQQQACT